MTLTLEQAMGLVGDMLVWPDPKDRTNAAAILAAMQQAAATIAEQGNELAAKTLNDIDLSHAYKVQANTITAQAAEIERLKMHHSFNPPSLDKYPNLDAVMCGCVSGSPSEWPLIRREIKDMAAEIERLTAVEEASRRVRREEAMLHQVMHREEDMDDEAVGNARWQVDQAIVALDKALAQASTKGVSKSHD